MPKRSDVTVTVAGDPARVAEFDKAGRDPGFLSWSHPSRQYGHFDVVDEGRAGMRGLPWFLAEPDPVAQSISVARMWLAPGAGAGTPWAPEQCSAAFPDLTLTTFAETVGGHHVVASYRAGQILFQDTFPADVHVLLFLPERDASCHVGSNGPFLPLHAGQLGQSMRGEYAQVGHLPSVVLLHHGEDTPAGRSKFDEFVRRVTGEGNVRLLGDETLERVNPTWAPSRRAAVLEVPLPVRVRVAAETVRGSDYRPGRFMPLLRELGLNSAIEAADLWRYAVDLTGASSDADVLLGVLPAVGALDPDRFDVLWDAVEDRGELNSMADIANWVKTLAMPANLDPEGTEFTAPIVQLNLPEPPDPWGDLGQVIGDHLYGIGPGCAPGRMPVLRLEAYCGRYLQYLGGGDELVAEVAGPTRIEDDQAYVYGERVYTFYNGKSGDILEGFGFTLANPEDNFQRFYDACDWEVAAQAAVVILRDVMRVDASDVEVSVD
jgi:hypothetical protein